MTRDRTREKGKGARRGTGMFVLERDKGLPLDGEETDVAHRQMADYKDKGETLC